MTLRTGVIWEVDFGLGRKGEQELMTAPIGKVFVSHSSMDKLFVDRLVGDLSAREVPVWYDKLDMRVGDSVTGRINEGLAGSKYFLIVLSKSSVESRWVKEELNSALMQQVASGGTFLLPVVLEDCDIYRLCYNTAVTLTSDPTTSAA